LGLNLRRGLFIVLPGHRNGDLCITLGFENGTNEFGQVSAMNPAIRVTFQMVGYPIGYDSPKRRDVGLQHVCSN
jgi:hypothetical protein